MLFKPGELLPEPIVLHTPSVSLNHVLGGGITTDRITTFWGNPMSGKTTLALHIMGKAQREQGFTPVIWDAEGGYTDVWGERCGIDISKRYLGRSCVVEDIANEILPMMRSGHKYVILIDSVSGLIFESTDKNDDGGMAMGIHARAQKWLTRKITSNRSSNVAVIYVAQQAVGMNQMGGFIKPNFGNAVEHYSTNIIKLFSSKSADEDNLSRDKETNIITGQRTTWTIDKCRAAAIGAKGSYWFNPGDATIDKRKEILHIAVRMGIITKGGAWYNYGENKYQGMNKLRDALTQSDYDLLEETIMGAETLGEDTDELTD